MQAVASLDKMIADSMRDDDGDDDVNISADEESDLMVNLYSYWFYQGNMIVDFFNHNSPVGMVTAVIPIYKNYNYHYTCHL